MNIGKRIVTMIGSIAGRFSRKPQPSVVPKFDPRQRLSITELDFQRWIDRHFTLKRSQHQDSPKLSGARLERMIEACSPKHLTVLCRGAQITYNKEQEC